jgi:hypothetical protein
MAGSFSIARSSPFIAATQPAAAASATTGFRSPALTFTPASPIFTDPIRTFNPIGPIVADPFFPRPPFIPPVLPVPPVQQPPAQPPPSVTASVTDLQILISQIPAAEDGNIIRSEHFNQMRLALTELAKRLGVVGVEEDFGETIAPNFFRNGSDEGWVSEYGIAKTPAVAATVRGWMEVELPNGARLDQMLVYGKRTGAGAFNVILRRQKIQDPASIVDLITVPITSTTDAEKGERAEVKVLASDLTELEERRRIKNSDYKYLLIAEATLAAATDSAQINAVQVVYRIA